MDNNPTNTSSNDQGTQQGSIDSQNYAENFDPTKDIDLSHIDIIDTSKGDRVDFGNVAFSQVYAFRCLNCDFKYEGGVLLEKCPRCGSDKIDDSM